MASSELLLSGRVATAVEVEEPVPAYVVALLAVVRAAAELVGEASYPALRVALVHAGRPRLRHDGRAVLT